MTLFPATAIEINGRAVLIEGPPGAGKSDLAFRCLARGARLIGDDYAALEKKGGTLYASPPENITGKLEVRGFGILDFPAARDIPVAALVSLCPRKAIPRAPEKQTRKIEGIDIPTFPLHAFDASAPEKIFLFLGCF